LSGWFERACTERCPFRPLGPREGISASKLDARSHHADPYPVRDRWRHRRRRGSLIATVVVSDYLVQFGQSTLENWQLEFLQLFSFVVFSAVLIHKRSAESKDSDEEMQATLNRIEKRLDALDPERASVKG
jgi:hypothetical protein